MKIVIIRATHRASGMVQELPFICPNNIVHIDFETALYNMLSAEYDNITTPAAGSIALGFGFKIGGESKSIGVSIRKEDEALLSMIDYTQGIVK